MNQRYELQLKHIMVLNVSAEQTAVHNNIIAAKRKRLLFYGFILMESNGTWLLNASRKTIQSKIINEYF